MASLSGFLSDEIATALDTASIPVSLSCFTNLSSKDRLTAPSSDTPMTNTSETGDPRYASSVQICVSFVVVAQEITNKQTGIAIATYLKKFLMNEPSFLGLISAER